MKVFDEPLVQKSHENNTSATAATRSQRVNTHIFYVSTTWGICDCLYMLYLKKRASIQWLWGLLQECQTYNV